MRSKLSLVRHAIVTVALCGCLSINAFAQSPQLVFTVAVPEPRPSHILLKTSAVVEERGLALWAGTASDFGVGVSVSNHLWTVRSITSMTLQEIDHHDRPTFQQMEFTRPLFSIGSTTMGGGGGIRQEWDGTRVLIGRVLAGSNIGAGRLQGSLVLERAVSSTVNHDAADLVTTVGWSRPITDRFSLGVEAIGQDLEGFWDPAEADGGAKLLIGPSIHAESPRGDWSASLTGGPVLHTVSTTSLGRTPVTAAPTGHNFGIFASATWMPFARR